MWVVLLFFLAIAGIIWVFFRDYRQKTQKWEAASKARFDKIFAEQAVRAATTSAPVPSAAPAAAPAKPAPVPARVTERFLAQGETLAYLLLRTGIPDHVVFAKVPVESIIAAPGTGLAGGAWQRVAHQRVDFLVCDRSMHVTAVIKLRAGVHTEGQGPSAIEVLRGAGVRIVEIDTAHMPHRDEIRKLVLGEGAPSPKP